MQTEVVAQVSHLVIDLVVDSVNAFLYWTTALTVECARMNGEKHQVFQEQHLFSNKQVNCKIRIFVFFMNTSNSFSSVCGLSIFMASSVKSLFVIYHYGAEHVKNLVLPTEHTIIVT